MAQEEKYILTLKSMIGDMLNLRKDIATKEKNLAKVQLQVDRATLSKLQAVDLTGARHSMHLDRCFWISPDRIRPKEYSRKP